MHKKRPAIEGKQGTTMYLDPAIHRAIKVEAAQRGITMAELLTECFLARTRMIVREAPNEESAA